MSQGSSLATPGKSKPTCSGRMSQGSSLATPNKSKPMKYLTVNDISVEYLDEHLPLIPCPKCKGEELVVRLVSKKEYSWGAHFVKCEEDKCMFWWLDQYASELKNMKGLDARHRPVLLLIEELARTKAEKIKKQKQSEGTSMKMTNNSEVGKLNEQMSELRVDRLDKLQACIYDINERMIQMQERMDETHESMKQIAAAMKLMNAELDRQKRVNGS